ncbi:hypothetical protein MBLNU230_g1550t1 [Neophaeotheca triangularis]
MKRVAKPSKSREGCARCKTKKIKCDQARPACQACQRASVECPGYDFQYKWSRKHERLNGASADFRNHAADEANVACTEPAATTCVPPTEETNALQTIHGTSQVNQTQQISAHVDHSTLPESPIGGDSQAVVEDAPVQPAGPVDVTFPYRDQAALGTDFDDLWQFGMPFANDMTANDISMFNLGSISMPPSLDYQAQAQLFPWTDPLTQRQPLQRLGPQGTNPRDTRTSAERAMAPSSGLRPGARSLLGTFYRLSTPSSVAHFSEEHLVQHYFTAVCPLFSCFDSTLNPFRTMVEEMKSSKTIHIAIQSMAIAHLANHYLYMGPLGQLKHLQAWRSLQLDLQLNRAGKLPMENIMVSLLLLGLSSAWQQPSNLGLQYLSVARSLMQSYLCGTAHGSSDLREEKFFTDSLMHWEMLASFIDPVPMAPFPGYGSPNPHVPGESEREPELPHPWTGISTELHFALGEVGRVLRRRRCTDVQPARRQPEADLPEIDVHWALSLEEFVYAIVIPQEDAILDYGHGATPKVDLIRSADANRHIALLEIYTCFPTILENKLAAGSLFPKCYDQRFHPPADADHQANSNYVESCACALAEFTLNIIKCIPVTSGACRMQLLTLISCASQLRLPKTSQDSDDARSKEISDSRDFVKERMLALSRKYPQKQIMQLLDVINEVWERLDELKDYAHWMHVVHDKRLQTMLG